MELAISIKVCIAIYSGNPATINIINVYELAGLIVKLNVDGFPELFKSNFCYLCQLRRKPTPSLAPFPFSNAWIVSDTSFEYYRIKSGKPGDLRLVLDHHLRGLH